jgi:hypothetical protein
VEVHDQEATAYTDESDNFDDDDDNIGNEEEDEGMEWNNLSHSFVMDAVFARICWTWMMKSRSLSLSSHHKRKLEQENFLMEMKSVMRLTFNMFKPYSIICMSDRRRNDAMPRRRLFFLFVISIVLSLYSRIT